LEIAPKQTELININDSSALSKEQTGVSQKNQGKEAVPSSKSVLSRRNLSQGHFTSKHQNPGSSKNHNTITNINRVNREAHNISERAVTSNNDSRDNLSNKNTFLKNYSSLKKPSPSIQQSQQSEAYENSMTHNSNINSNPENEQAFDNRMTTFSNIVPNSRDYDNNSTGRYSGYNKGSTGPYNYNSRILATEGQGGSILDNYNNVSKSKIFNNLNQSKPSYCDSINNNQDPYSEVFSGQGYVNKQPLSSINRLPTGTSRVSNDNLFYESQERYDSRENNPVNSKYIRDQDKTPTLQGQLSTKKSHTVENMEYNSPSLQDPQQKRPPSNLMDYYIRNNDQELNSNNIVGYRKPLTRDVSSDSINKPRHQNQSQNHSTNPTHNKEIIEDQENNSNVNSTNQQPNTINQSNSVQSVLPNVQSSYSREYVNELRSIFLREKNELLFKNSTMQNTLDKLKNNFAEQIAQMTNQIEETNKKHQFSLKSLEENIDSYYKTVILEKETQIEEQNQKIGSLLESNKSLSERLNAAEIAYDDLSSKKASMEDFLNSQLKHKDEELRNLRRDFSEKENVYSSEIESHGNYVARNYEENMNGLVKGFDEVKAKLNQELNNKEAEIVRLSAIVKEADDKYKKTILDLEEEVTCHKQNIMCYRDRRIELENELKNYKDLLDNVKREIKMKCNEVKVLESNSEALAKDNDDLRIQITKLDKLVYGKVKGTPKYKN